MVASLPLCFPLAASAVTNQADLALTMTDSSDPVQIGNNLTFSLTSINFGPSIAGDNLIASGNLSLDSITLNGVGNQTLQKLLTGR